MFKPNHVNAYVHTHASPTLPTPILTQSEIEQALTPAELRAILLAGDDGHASGHANAPQSLADAAPARFDAEGGFTMRVA